MPQSNFFQLSFQIAKKGFKLRNEGSYLGIFWYLLNPLLMFVLLFFVFSDRLGSGIPLYTLYLLLGIIMFNFFQNATTESSRTIVKDYSGLVKSIKFPREAIVAGVVLKSIFSHLFEIILFSVFLFFLSGSVQRVIFYIPILLFFSVFIFGVSLVLSALIVYFVDLENIWNFGVRLLWLSTPIFYAIGGQTKLFYINLFNPVYYFITIAREIVVYNRAPASWLILGAAFYTILFLFVGILVFSKLKNKFAEMI